MSKSFKLALATAAIVSGAAWAQPANHNPAMREACKDDIATLCAGVPQGMQTMQCMMKNEDKLSEGCKSAQAAMRGNARGQMNGNMGGNMDAMGKPEDAGKGMGMSEEAKGKAKEKMKEKMKEKKEKKPE